MKTNTNPQMTLETLKEIFEEEINPMVEQDGGFIELIEASNGFVYIRMLGACKGCASSIITLKHGISALLEEYFPEEFLSIINLEG